MLRVSYKSFIYAVPLAALLVGCSTPQTPAQFRQADKLQVNHNHFEVKRSYQTVANILKQKSKQCLNVTVKSHEHTSDNTMEKYTSRVNAGSNKTELSLQAHTVGANTLDEPAGGSYVMVVDVINKGKGMVGVDMYTPALSYKNLARQVEGWIRGTSTSCPDLSRSDAF